MTAPLSYQLDLSCSFCGGKLRIDEASRTTRCGHCASVLKMVRHSGIARYYIDDNLKKREVKFLVERYLKKHNLPLVTTWKELGKLYLPFWRVTGTLFWIKEPRGGLGLDFPNWQGGEEEFHEAPKPEVRIVPKEITVCADDSFPWALYSLGIRTKVIKLKPAEKEFFAESNLAAITMLQEEAERRFKSSSSLAGLMGVEGECDLNWSEVGIESSLIYFPLWLASFANADGNQLAQFDPVAKRVVDLSPLKVEVKPGKNQTPLAAAGIDLVPHRCPNCGEDLPASERSVTFYCSNCRRLLVDRGNDYGRLRVRIPKGLDPQFRLFPFWVFDLKACKFAKPRKFKRLLKLLSFRPDRFYVPAFALSNPTRMLRLITHYNTREDTFEFAESPSDRYSFADVTLDFESAADLMVPLTNAVRAMKSLPTGDPWVESGVEAAEPELVWLPFAPDRYFWREQITGATIEKAAVLV